LNTVIGRMLKSYQVENLYDQKNAMKEIMQEIVLCGLSRSGFFKRAAFYGGTALRIFYGLDRFSEDLDFSLETADAGFDLSAYFPVLENEVRSFGLNMTIAAKEKTKDSDIRSAFLKGNTKEHLLLFYADERIAGSVTRNETVKIKLEVDVSPPAYATFEHKYRLLPAPFEVNLYDMPSLFAGKIHAVICRAWRSRIKGRDLFDYVFYLQRGASVNLKHLRERLIASQYITAKEAFGISELKGILTERFKSVDYSQAKQDAVPFVHDPSALNVWCAEFFKQITQGLTGI